MNIVRDILKNCLLYILVRGTNVVTTKIKKTIFLKVKKREFITNTV